VWKTSLQLPYADQCVLLKTLGTSPGSAGLWTYACKISPASALNPQHAYENIVRAVQSALNLNYQPDESATNVNQVFFGDSSRPAWRLFVTKRKDSSVVLWIAPKLISTAVPFSEPAPTSGATIHDEIEKIRQGQFSPMPPAQRSTAGAAWGKTTMTVQNSTAYELTVFYDGPVSMRMTLAPSASQTIDLAPGAFHVAGRVSASNVLPFYGEETYAGSASYSESFYIAP
jgi:hypothetical protein